MPELPEVETVRRALEPMLVGRTVKGVETFVPSLREPLNAAELTSISKGKIKAIRRRAKFLLFDFAGGRCLIAHLGMTGSFRIEPAGSQLRKHDRAVFHLDKNEDLIYNDIRRFGVLKGCELESAGAYPPELDHFGPEPLQKEFSAAYLQECLTRCKGPLKPFIMDQKTVVGVGNIYASEALFCAGILPERAGNSINAAECKKLVACIKKVLNNSLADGGTTISDYRRPDGSEGKFALRLKVYGRAGDLCTKRGCGGIIERSVMGGRSTFFCRQCQK